MKKIFDLLFYGIFNYLKRSSEKYFAGAIYREPNLGTPLIISHLLSLNIESIIINISKDSLSPTVTLDLVLLNLGLAPLFWIIFIKSQRYKVINNKYLKKSGDFKFLIDLLICIYSILTLIVFLLTIQNIYGDRPG